VSKVRGWFKNFSGTITIADDPLQSSVEATIDAASIDTREPQRDAHLRSPDFLDVERYPEITFRSTSVQPRGDGYVVAGELTIHGVTRLVQLDLEFNGVQEAPNFGKRAGFSASTEISRADFGMEFNMPLDGGGVVVGDKIKINLEVEATLRNKEG
jgi:polyisoprenoid-binding protein YceI